MFKRVIIIQLLLAIALAACSPTLAGQSEPYYTDVEKVIVEEVAVAPGAGYGDTASSVFSSESADVEHIVIKNANLTLAVDDPPQSMERISLMADEMGGFVVSANMYQTYLDSGAKVPQASITIRVPAERLNEALSRIKDESTQPVISENISSQDVTSEYTDLQSRLRNLEAAEAQLQNIMDAATKTEDVLSVYSELTAVREQIEVIKGQIQYYEQSAALSAISVELLTNEAVQPLTIGGWQPAGVVKDALQALINTLKFIATSLIWVVLYGLPVGVICLGPPAVVVWLVLRWRARRKARPVAAPPPDEA